MHSQPQRAYIALELAVRSYFSRFRSVDLIPPGPEELLEGTTCIFRGDLLLPPHIRILWGNIDFGVLFFGMPCNDLGDEDWCLRYCDESSSTAAQHICFEFGSHCRKRIGAREFPHVWNLDALLRIPQPAS